MQKEILKEIVKEIDKMICFNSRYEMKVDIRQRIDEIDENIKKLNRKIEIIRNIILLDIIFLLIAIIFTR